MKEVTCMCGWQCRGTEAEIIEQVRDHGLTAHGIDSTVEEILALAYDAPTGAGSEAGPVS